MHYVLKTLNLLLFCLTAVHYFLHFILSPNLFLSNLLTKNEDVTSEAGLSNWSKGTLRCSLMAQLGLLTCCLKVMLQMAFLCMCMDFVNGGDCPENCAVACNVKRIFSWWVLSAKRWMTKRILIYNTTLWLMALITKILLRFIKVKTPLKFPEKF